MKIENFFAIYNSNENSSKANFIKDFKNFLLSVDEEFKKSENLKKEFLKNENIPIYEVLVQSQKAKISLELLTRLRDEALKAYNEIMNMRI